MQPSSRWMSTTLMVVLLLLVSCCTAKITIIAPQEGRQPAPVPTGDAPTVSTEDFEATSTEDPDSASTEDFGSTSTEVTTLVGDPLGKNHGGPAWDPKTIDRTTRLQKASPRRACPRTGRHPSVRSALEFNGITTGAPVETVATCKNYPKTRRFW
uniref:Putative secreted mucin n=1 Tax=Ixodes ricinus TaxID=34613 RepID=A0A090X9M9_IXORI